MLMKGREESLFTDLETERLLLKNIGLDDQEFILSQFSNDTINRYLFDAEPMTEAMQAIISFAGQQMGVREIRACIYVENERSIRLAERMGFKFSGTCSQTFRGTDYPHNIYSLFLN
jgi:hypothetical protein